MLSVQASFKQGFPIVTLYTNLGEEAVKHGLKVVEKFLFRTWLNGMIILPFKQIMPNSNTNYMY